MSIVEILMKDKLVWNFFKSFYELPQGEWYIEFPNKTSSCLFDFLDWKKNGDYYKNPDNGEWFKAYKFVTNAYSYTSDKDYVKFVAVNYIYYSDRVSLKEISFSRFKRAMILKKILEEKNKKSETI